jgi:ubiquinone/menaquinone biosynthesis C-methylase UbiE
MSSHDDTVRREFAKQAATFEDPDYSFADRRLIAWIQRNVPAEPRAAVLDVAGGTGHMARAYADTSSVAVVLDLTDEMLATGQRQAQAAGRGNVVFVRGDARCMAFIDDSFDLVVSRFAVHHFERPEEQIGEMVRVCRAGGRVAIIDLVAADPALAAAQDRLERMRDPSHVRALPIGDLRTLLEEAGAPVFHKTFHDQRLSVERWLAQASTSPDKAKALRAEIRGELDGGTPTGMLPLLHDGELHLTHRYAIVVARKPSDHGYAGA